MSSSGAAIPRALFNQLLPIEVKTTIFSLAHQHAVAYDGPAVFSSSHPSVAISQVCGEWREVSLSTPQLWTDVHAVFPRGTVEMYQQHPNGELYIWGVKERLERLVTKLTVWFERSRSLPLTVTGMSAAGPWIEATEAHEESRNESLAALSAFNRARTLITSSSSRWSKIELPVIDHNTRAQRIFYEDNAWRMLDLLQWVALAGDFAALSPKLSSLRIETPFSFNGRYHMFSILRGHTWGALQDLALLQVDWRRADDVLELLGSCRNLVNFELLSLPYEWPRYTGRKTVTLPRLRCITFGCTPPLLGMHEVFDLPALKSFTLSALCVDTNETSHGGRDSKYRESMTDWMERFGTGLTELNIINHGTRIPSDTWLIACLKNNLLPNITHIRSLGRRDHDFLLNRLASGLPSGEPCCPRLQEFVSMGVENCSATLSEKAALEFVAARLNSSAMNLVDRLRYVEIGVTVPDSSISSWNQLDVLAELMKRGVDLRGTTIKLVYRSYRSAIPHVKTVFIDSGTLMH